MNRKGKESDLLKDNPSLMPCQSVDTVDTFIEKKTITYKIYNNLYTEKSCYIYQNRH